ncbi:hypothetical protein V6N13_145272 [Hibiscus sabdariffa]
MAPTFTSDPFHLTTRLQPRLTLNNPRFTVFAKRSPFQLARAKDNPDQQGQAEDSTNSTAEKAGEEANAAKRPEEEEAKKLSEKEGKADSRAKEAEEKAEGAGASMKGVLSKAKDFSAGFSKENFSSQISTAVQKPSDEEKPNKGKVATCNCQETS